MKKGTARGNKNKGSEVKMLLMNSGLGALIGFIITILSVLLISALCLLSDNPHVLVTPMCMFSIYSSAFFAGLIAQKKTKGSVLLCGALCGVILALVLIVFSALLRIGIDTGNEYFSPILKILVIPASLIGALIGAYSPKKSKNRRKRR